jgi:hypothetical protein
MRRLLALAFSAFVISGPAFASERSDAVLDRIVELRIQRGDSIGFSNACTDSAMDKLDRAQDLLEDGSRNTAPTDAAIAKAKRYVDQGAKLFKQCER